MLDAAANRAMEAARVLEDLARFVVEDRDLVAGFKEIRHTLAGVVEGLAGAGRTAHRDVAGDPGTTLQGEREGTRRSLGEVAAANASRLTEALRSIEECAKLGGARGVGGAGESPAAKIESLRYRAYTLCATLALRLAPSEPKQWKVCLLLTRSMCLGPWREVLDVSLAAGLDAVQVREKEGSTAELVAYAREVVALAHARGASVMVNDRVDVALASGADGVHLGIDDLGVCDARAMATRPLIIGATAHNEAQAEAALAAGADLCGVGAMFPSATKPNATVAGPAWIERFVERWPQVPHLAIGGVTVENVRDLVAKGCRGVAVSSAVLGAVDPGEVVSRLREAIP